MKTAADPARQSRNGNSDYLPRRCKVRKGVISTEGEKSFWDPSPSLVMTALAFSWRAWRFGARNIGIHAVLL